MSSIFEQRRQMGSMLAGPRWTIIFGMALAAASDPKAGPRQSAVRLAAELEQEAGPRQSSARRREPATVRELEDGPRQSAARRAAEPTVVTSFAPCEVQAVAADAARSQLGAAKWPQRGQPALDAAAAAASIAAELLDGSRAPLLS